MNKNQKNKPELATFTLLNPDFHPMESDLDSTNEDIDENTAETDTKG
ncbi:hypothetical protein GMD78_17180 [Ornithinibacillus sp. L9]|uniref:Uncharacterized protein n=1 Tax=Ornithinibacillus caprae TaxID=2678566 RepID=A0A6N8FR03_9BACI|nr:hypothetical protein [Ornithinibacillus caprae]MUK90108.1 hypothetical protein [Ornithinibacillus caprae]